jgi:hypothetical protein
MEDMKASAEKLRAEADYAEQIARSATAVQKRELCERLAVHFRQLAYKIEKVMADRTGKAACRTGFRTRTKHRLRA